MSLAIQITKDTATPRLNALRESLTPGRLSAAVGPACARLTQTHLRQIGGNKKGYPTTNFWSRAAKATNWRRTPEGTIIAVNQVGVRQRFYGGEIAAVNAGALTIPISPVSYGHVAADFPGLFAVRTPKGTYLCQREEGGDIKKSEWNKQLHGLGGNVKARRTEGQRQQGALNFLFRLVKSVTQGPDPGVLPDMSEYRRETHKAVMAAVIKRDK